MHLSISFKIAKKVETLKHLIITDSQNVVDTSI